MLPLFRITRRLQSSDFVSVPWAEHLRKSLCWKYRRSVTDIGRPDYGPRAETKLASAQPGDASDSPFAEGTAKAVLRQDRQRFITPEETDRLLAVCNPT